MFKLDSSTGFNKDDGTEQVPFSSDDENGPHWSLCLNPSPSPLISTSSTAPQQLALSATAPTATDTNAATAVVTASTPTMSSALQRSSSLSTVTFIPNAVWKDVWTPQPGPYTGFFSMASIADDVYAIATDGNLTEDLNVHASSMPGLVEAFKTMLMDAAKNSNFTHVLCPGCAFNM